MNAMEIKGLTKNYNDFSLDGVNLTLPSGCIMGLIGENGAGKSTIIKLILNMLKIDGGSITILDRDSVTDSKSIKDDLGVVLDETGFPENFNASDINQVLKYTYSRWDEKLFFEYMEKFSLPKDKPFGEFSKGMKMKMNIATAISHDPKLLILDEPTNGLDPVVRDEVVDILSEFTRDESHSIFICSHIVSDLEKICDYIAFIHKGRLMLCEQKDMLLEQYAFIHCTAQQLGELDQKSIIGKKENPYGVQAIVKRDSVPAGFELGTVDLENLFVFMVREG